MECMVGLPDVSVPVLSNSTKSALAMFRLCPPLAGETAADEADSAVACGTGRQQQSAWTGDDP